MSNAPEMSALHIEMALENSFAFSIWIRKTCRASSGWRFGSAPNMPSVAIVESGVVSLMLSIVLKSLRRVVNKHITL